VGWKFRWLLQNPSNSTSTSRWLRLPIFFKPTITRCVLQ
jgi:hypothetical protein